MLSGLSLTNLERDLLIIRLKRELGISASEWWELPLRVRVELMQHDIRQGLHREDYEQA